MEALLMNTTQTAAFLGICDKTVLLWETKGLLPTPYRLNGRRYWHRLEVEEALAAARKKEEER